ncbi:MAG TPA: glutathione peroxidase, partial [Rhodanobacteraceae bacterium]|nr:glutathione peroxidase [Rhodanobacteraceae bacterium]
MATIYDFEANLLDGTQQKLDAWRGKVLLIVNVASKCGFTPQYEGLETLYR